MPNGKAGGAEAGWGQCARMSQMPSQSPEASRPQDPLPRQGLHCCRGLNVFAASQSPSGDRARSQGEQELLIASRTQQRRRRIAHDGKTERSGRLRTAVDGLQA